MRNELISFDFKGNEVRVIGENDEPWFVAKDVATVLGYTNTVKAINDHCKGVTKRYVPTAGGLQEMSLIPESDLYRLTLKSNLPGAVEFQEWVVEIVLPAIRKTGGYIMGEEHMNEDEMILAAMQMQQRKVELLRKQLAEQAPKVEVYEKWLDSDGYYSLDVAGRLLGYPNKAKFCAYLRTLEILTKEKKPKSKDGKSRGYKNEPTTAYAELGWFVTKPWENGKGFSGTATKVTKIGLLGLTEKFKELGILGEDCMLMPNAPELTQLN